jgi:hypothetical protein
MSSTSHRIRYLVGEALELLVQPHSLSPLLLLTFDLVFVLLPPALPVARLVICLGRLSIKLDFLAGDKSFFHT